MPRNRTELERAVGKLISSIQKEWGEVLGEPGATVSEEAMHNCHDLLGAASTGTLKEFLAGRSVEEYIGRHWVRAHPAVRPDVRHLQGLLDMGQNEQV